METIQDPVRRQLAAKLSVLDELIKNVTNALEAKGMLKDCLIIYTAGTCLYLTCQYTAPQNDDTICTWPDNDRVVQITVVR
jgi:hypothetical protein